MADRRLYEQAISEMAKNPEQLAAVRERGHCVVLAGPGSGKTKTLTTAMARTLLEDVVEPRGIACITYNNECAIELEGRLAKLGIEPNERIFIGTVHSFALTQVIYPYAWGYEGREIVFLAGKHSREHEVINSKTPTGTNIRVTSLERTLIDLAVRPAYARGLADILGAYKNAKDRISIKKMLEILQVLDHAYPYHQAVGFYLERAGVSRAATRPLHKLGLNLDFYLGNRIAKAGFDEYWRIHYPSDLDGDETKLASKFRRQKETQEERKGKVSTIQPKTNRATKR